MNNLKIANMVLSGNLPLKNLDFERIIKNSKLFWEIINEETSPILQVKIVKNGLNIYKKKKHACISIWRSGKIVIVGVTSRKEAENYYNLIVSDLKKLIS